MTATILNLAPFAWLVVVLSWAWATARRERQLDRLLEALPGIALAATESAASFDRMALECQRFANVLREFREEARFVTDVASRPAQPAGEGPGS